MENSDLLSVLQTFFATHPEYSNKDKGDWFKKAVLTFLSFDQTQKSIFKKVQFYSEFINDHPEYKWPDSSDLGIDLVATTHEDCYFAVQCKFHTNPQHVVTSEEIASFRALVGALKIFRGGNPCHY